MAGSSGGSEPTFYETLGVGEGASAAEIREAFRERVKATHPDVNDAPDAGRRFRRVKRAHEVLGDPRERRRYDRLGHEAYVTSGDSVAHTRGDTVSRGWKRKRGDRGGGTSQGAHDAGTTAGGWTRRNSGDGGPSNERGGYGGRSGRDDRSRTGGMGDANAESRTTPSGSDPMESVSVLAYGLARWIRFAGALVDAWQASLGPTGPAIALATLAAYPILLASTVTSLLPLGVNLVVGMFTVTLLGYLVARPEIGVAVLGTWMLALPVVLTISGIGVLSSAGLYSLLLTGVPLLLCVSTLLGASA